ncbi:hypothetical protein JCM11491_003344 [Sporobolomyces phaffii]
MGIDLEIFVKKVPDYLICPLCDDALEHPEQICTSQHLGCHDCIEAHFEGVKRKRCPVCRISVRKTTIKPSPFIERVVKALDVKCESSGCDWQGPLSECPKHLSQSCRFNLSACPLCDEPVPAFAVGKHWLYCPEEFVSCPRGGPACFEYRRKHRAAHAQTCDQYPCQATPGCPTRTTLRNIGWHNSFCASLFNQCQHLRARLGSLEHPN